MQRKTAPTGTEHAGGLFVPILISHLYISNGLFVD